MVPVTAAALGEPVCIGMVRAGVEHTRFVPVARDAVAPQITDVARERRRAVTRARLANDPRLHDNPATIGMQAGRQGGPPAPTDRPGAALAQTARPTQRAGAHRCPLYLCSQFGGAANICRTPIADLARPYAEIVPVIAHGRKGPQKCK